MRVGEMSGWGSVRWGSDRRGSVRWGSDRRGSVRRGSVRRGSVRRGMSGIHVYNTGDNKDMVREKTYRKENVKILFFSQRLWLLLKIKNLFPTAAYFFVKILRQYYVNITSILRQYYVNITSILRQYYVNITSILRQYYVNITSILRQYYVNITSILRQYYAT